MNEILLWRLFMSVSAACLLALTIIMRFKARKYKGTDAIMAWISTGLLLKATLQCMAEVVK